jgi:hypothetical protein
MYVSITDVTKMDQTAWWQEEEEEDNDTWGLQTKSLKTTQF